MQIYSYKVYSLLIESEIEFPEFLPIENEGAADVFIKIGKTPKEIKEKNVVKKIRHESIENELLYHLHGAGMMYVKDGNSIKVEPDENVDWDHLKNHIRSRGLAAIIQQRRWTLLHGSVIEYNNQAIVFLGRTGSGKSTTASAFVKKGYNYLSDDLAMIKQDENANYQVHPAYPNIRLWSYAIQLLGEENNEYLEKGRQVRKDIDKFYMTPKTEYIQSPLPISKIYILSVHQQEEVMIEAVPTVEKLNLLLKNSFAKSHMDGLGGRPEQFKTITTLMNTIEIKTIKRPSDMKKEAFWKMINQIELDFQK